MAKKDEAAAVAEKPAPAEKVREVPHSLTKVDDKRAQYARLVIGNWIKSNPKTVGLKAADVSDVHAISDKHILDAGKQLVGGNFLDGKEGLEFISEHSANGSTTGRGLTQSYASEVRPFLRKLKVSEGGLSRRGGLSEEEKAAREKKRDEEKAARAKEREEKKAEREKVAAEKKAAKEKADAEAKAAKEKEEKAAAAKAEAEKK